ncbi:MAG: N-acetylglucosamine kinase [Bacilli bacterium]
MYLGIDSGGTSTIFTLIDQNKAIIIQKEYPTIHLHQVKATGMIQVLNEGINYFKQYDLQYIFFAIAGYAESIHDDQTINDIIKSLDLNIPYHIDNDMMAGMVGSLNNKDGINIIAGTGSIASIRIKDTFFRVGGWGPIIGDEGSAYWVGLKILNEYTKQKDGRHQPSALLDLLTKELELNPQHTMIDLVYNEYQGARTKIAAISKYLDPLMKLNCPYTKEIIAEAVFNLKEHIEYLALKDDQSPITCSYSGGLFKSQAFSSAFKEALNNSSYDINLIEPIHDPNYGSALYAYYLAHKNNN